MSKYTPEQLDKIFEQVKELVEDAHNKLRVLDLRLFIDQLYPREGDIYRKDFDYIKHCFIGLNNRVRRIENCLGIDYKLDEEKPVLDYSYIKDEILRDKATAYYREMLRYQYATRNHKQCFGEFCRLATIQLEFMLNYFFKDEFNIKFLDDEITKMATNRAFFEWKCARKKWVKNGSVGIEPPQPQDADIKRMKDAINRDEAVSQILLSKKRDVFIEMFNLKECYINNISLYSVFSWTANLRNNKSHGSKSSLDPYEEKYLTEEEEVILGELNRKLLKYFEEYNKKNDNKINFRTNKRIGWFFKLLPTEEQKIYNKFQPLQWKFEKPFKDVHELLRIVASTCAKELSNNNKSN